MGSLSHPVDRNFVLSLGHWIHNLQNGQATAEWRSRKANSICISNTNEHWYTNSFITRITPTQLYSKFLTLVGGDPVKVKTWNHLTEIPMLPLCIWMSGPAKTLEFKRLRFCVRFETLWQSTTTYYPQWFHHDPHPLYRGWCRLTC